MLSSLGGQERILLITSVIGLIMLVQRGFMRMHHGKKTDPRYWPPDTEEVVFSWIVATLVTPVLTVGVTMVGIALYLFGNWAIYGS